MKHLKTQKQLNKGQENLNISDVISSKMTDKLKYQQIIDGVIKASSGKDLKVLLDEVYDYKWKDGTRQMFLIGLLQGSLMQFNKEASVEELLNLLYDK
jgi:hypothetical protein